MGRVAASRECGRERVSRNCPGGVSDSRCLDGRGLIRGCAAVTAPLAVYVLHGHLSQLSTEWEEAAWIDGAGLAQVLASVVVPMIAPAVAATAIIVFVLDWNMLLVPLVLAGVEIRTLPVAMVDFFTFERELDWPTAAAALIISLLPLTILVAIGHRLLDEFTLTPREARLR